MATAIQVPGIGRVTLTDLHRVMARRSAIHFDYWTSGFRRQKPRHLQFISDFICPRLDKGDARIIVCAPPGHGKSELISRATCAWFIWKHPEKLIGLIGHTKSFADTWGRKVRDLILEHPNLGIRLDQGEDAAVGEWRTKLKDGSPPGGMVCAGIDGNIMGKRFGLVVIDDPIKNSEDAYSPVIQEKLRGIYQSTISSRLNPGASVIVTMQRWPSSDFVTWLLEQKESGREDWDIILLPAIAEVDDQLGRKRGEPLWPEFWPLRRLESRRLTLEDQSLWFSQYQQQPPETSTEGLAYHAFSAQHSVRALAYDPSLPILLGCDFNWNPMCWVIAQSKEYFTAERYDTMTLTQYEEVSQKEIRILGEICLRDSNTFAATDEFIARAKAVVPKGQKIEVIVYGDVSGHAHKTTGAPDFQVIRERFTRAGFTFDIKTPPKDPAVRSRVVTVNNAFVNAAGQRRLFIDPGCKELITDLNWMRWKLDVAGNSTNELDKSNKQRSHVSDALGYLCWGELKMSSASGWV